MMYNHNSLLRKFTLSLFFSIYPVIGFAQGYFEALEPIDSPQRDSLHFLQGQVLCYGGSGFQGLTFRLGKEEKTFSTITGTSIGKGAALGFPTSIYNSFNSKVGCQWNSFFWDITQRNYTLMTEESFTDRGVLSFTENLSTVKKQTNFQYNMVDLNQSVFTLGYSFSVIPDFLYANLGIAYATAIIDFGYLDETHTCAVGTGLYTQPQDPVQGDDETINTTSRSCQTSYPYYQENIFVSLEGRWFFNRFVFLSWRLEQNLGKDALMIQSNTWGLNFYARIP